MFVICVLRLQSVIHALGHGFFFPGQKLSDKTVNNKFEDKSSYPDLHCSKLAKLQSKAVILGHAKWLQISTAFG
jgi:hypothetical protein